MNNRRQFLKDATAAAGVVFTSCGLFESRLTAQPSVGRQRRQVSVGGRRIRTIDIHAHIVVPEATALLGVTTAPTDASVMGLAQTSEAFPDDGRLGHRHASPQHQPNLVCGGARRGRPGDQDAERSARRAVRQVSGPVRGLRFGGVAVSRSGRRAARRRREEVQPARRGHRGTRQRRRAVRAQVRPVLEEGRGVRRAGFHASAGDSGNEQAAGGQRSLDERDRQSTRDHDLSFASDLRRNVGSFPGPEDSAALTPAAICRPTSAVRTTVA